MEIKIQGRVKEIFETQTFDSGFQKREFVITVDETEKYPQDIKVETIKEKCSELDNINIGDVITADCNLRGNEWNGKYFNNIQAWKLEVNEAATADNDQKIAGVDDLPF